MLGLEENGEQGRPSVFACSRGAADRSHTLTLHFCRSLRPPDTGVPLRGFSSEKQMCKCLYVTLFHSSAFRNYGPRQLQHATASEYAVWEGKASLYAGR